MVTLRRIATALNAPARGRHLYPVAALLGLTVFLCVYGFSNFVGTSGYWQMPEADERMAFIGYRYFLHGTWHWPIFMNDAVNVPYPRSVAFLDCIPLWAILNKAAASIVPAWGSFTEHAYLGLWHGLAYMLQASLGAACIRALGHSSWRAGIAAAVFFLAVPTWIFRYPHAALSAHWLLLWALYLYLRTEPRREYPRSRGLAGVGQIACASLVTPYHAVMSLLIFTPGMLRSRDWRRAAVWIPLGFAAAAAMLWFAGYFSGEPSPPQWGFEWESANLLGWLIPQRSGIVGDAQWIAPATASPWQYEGYLYLGLGVIILSILLIRFRDLKATASRNAGLVIVCACSALFALSNRVYLSSLEVLHYRVPHLFRPITAQFRAPGRFVWIPVYALMLYVLHRALTRYTTWRRFSIIALLVVVQFIDATGDWRFQHTKTAGIYEQPLPLEPWRALVHAHEAVSILAPYGCVMEEDAGPYDHVSMEIQYLASEAALPINGTYSAREMRHCDAEEREWATMTPAPGMLYVLLPESFAVADRFRARGLACGAFDMGRACSTNRAAIDAATRSGILRELPPPISARYGEPISFRDDARIASGWTSPERDGRWTNTSIASVYVALPSAERTTIEITGRAAPCGSRTRQDVDVLLNESVVTTFHVEVSASTISVQLPPTTGPFALQFRPHELGCGSDPRRLGFLVSELSFQSAGT